MADAVAHFKLKQIAIGLLRKLADEIEADQIDERVDTHDGLIQVSLFLQHYHGYLHDAIEPRPEMLDSLIDELLKEGYVGE